jgi:hypothetical protein
LLGLTGTGFDTVEGSVDVEIGGVDCASVTLVSATSLSCVVPSSLTTGARDVTVTNTAITASDTLVSGVIYLDIAAWIELNYPAPNKKGTRLLKDVNKVLDGRGNCNNDVAKLARDLKREVTIGAITQAELDEVMPFLLSMCTQQLNPTPPSAPVFAAVASRGSVSLLKGAPVCSASFNPPSVSLGSLSPVVRHSFDRSGFDFAALWVRVGSGAWSQAIGLVPPDGSGTEIGWSTDFLQLLLHLAGQWTLSADTSYTLEFAYGVGGTFDTYSEDAVVCTQALSLYVGQLPSTGSNTTGIAQMAVWVTLAGALLATAGIRRRRRPALLKH